MLLQILHIVWLFLFNLTCFCFPQGFKQNSRPTQDEENRPVAFYRPKTVWDFGRKETPVLLWQCSPYIPMHILISISAINKSISVWLDLLSNVIELHLSCWTENELLVEKLLSYHCIYLNACNELEMTIAIEMAI